MRSIGQFLFSSCGSSLRCEWPYKLSWRNIHIGNKVFIGRYARMEAVGKNAMLTIGSETSIEQGAHIIFSEKLEIGEGTMISSFAFISDTNHIFISGKPPYRNGLNIKKTKIGKYCFIGAGAKILPGCILSDDVIIGANAVLLPGKYSAGIYVGNPARKKA